MLFLLWLTVRLLTRLLVRSDADDGAKDLEILVLRQQLRALRRKTGRPRFTARDRILLAAASRGAPRQRWVSFLVTPQTLLRWHRTLVRRKWTFQETRKPGRPPIDPVGASYSVTSCDLPIFMEQPTKSISPHDPPHRHDHS